MFGGSGEKAKTFVLEFVGGEERKELRVAKMQILFRTTAIENTEVQ